MGDSSDVDEEQSFGIIIGNFGQIGIVSQSCGMLIKEQSMLNNFCHR